MRQVTHTRVGQCRAYQVTACVRCFANKSESVALAPKLVDKGDRRRGAGVAASAAVEEKEKEEKKRRKRKTRRRRSCREAESIVTFFLCLSPCKAPSFFFFPFLFFLPPLTKFHTGAPCGTFYLPKAISNAPARTQVCSIVNRPTYRVPQPRVLPSLLCVWPL